MAWSSAVTDLRSWLIAEAIETSDRFRHHVLDLELTG
jgi:hypothetical protein